MGENTQATNKNTKSQATHSPMVIFDTELVRLSYTLQLFSAFRIWVYAAQVLSDGSGWSEKEVLRQFLNRINIKFSKRQMDRYIRLGEGVFWTYQRKTKRVFFTSSEKVSINILKLAMEQNDPTLETNRPGRLRMVADLTGSLERSIATAYAAWFASKSENVTISRELLGVLWNVSIPTLQKWESVSGITYTKNIAQSHNTSINDAPRHAYLCKDRDGKQYISWRMPNTYHAPEHIKEHRNIGNSAIIRKEINRVYESASNSCGLLEPSTLPANIIGQADIRLGRLYFERTDKSCGWTKANRHLRKHGDVFRNHYVRLGKARGTVIHERFDVVTNVQHTDLWQRDFQAEAKDSEWSWKLLIYRSNLINIMSEEEVKLMMFRHQMRQFNGGLNI